jgi:2-polyprenyl-6-methoxyphenol hydroxylase-like FAD-dependent oxidoreductase
MPDRVAVVIGAGVGGLTAANALARSGWDVTVAERADGLRPIGAGISIAPNAMHAFAAIGLGDAVEKAGQPAAALGAMRPDGRWIFESRGDPLVSRYGYPLYIHLRSDLLNVLAQPLGEKIRFGADAGSVQPGDDGQRAAVVLADGTRLEADLVVAADGGRSAVRDALFPGHPRPQYAGFPIWWMLTSVIGEPVVPSETLGSGAVFGIMPLRDGRVYAYATLLLPEERPPADPLAELRTAMASWHPQVRAILANVDPARVFRDDSRWMVKPLPAFHRGRVALIGDAAHPMTPDLGQGGCQAIEDAVVLARMLDARPPAGIPQALAAYTAARLERTTKITRSSRTVSRLHHVTTPLGMMIRDRLLWLGGRLPPSLALRSVDFIYTWRPLAVVLSSSRAAAASAVSVSPSGVSSFAAANSSPRVAPWLMITTGRPSLAACRTYRSPDMTASEEPSTISALARSTSA